MSTRYTFEISAAFVLDDTGIELEFGGETIGRLETGRRLRAEAIPRAMRRLLRVSATAIRNKLLEDDE